MTNWYHINLFIEAFVTHNEKEKQQSKDNVTCATGSYLHTYAYIRP